MGTKVFKLKKTLLKLTEAIDYIKEHFTKNELNLEMIDQLDILEEIVKEGLIQRFEYTYEMSWNVMKDYAYYQGNSEIAGSRDAILFFYGGLQLYPLFSQQNVLIYGSRAKGNYRNNSDIDLSLIEEINFDEVLSIKTKLDDLLLPYEFDISIFNKINNLDLVEHINQIGKIFYEKESPIVNSVFNQRSVTYRQKSALQKTFR